MSGETQENLGAPDPERQTLVDLNGKSVWIDNDFVSLIQELNRVGLITRSHCAGHENNIAFLVIRADNIWDISIRKDPPYNELIIHWNRPPQDD